MKDYMKDTTKFTEVKLNSIYTGGRYFKQYWMKGPVQAADFELDSITDSN